MRMSARSAKRIRRNLGCVLIGAALAVGASTAAAQVPQSPGPLSTAHKALETPDACPKCHNPVPKIEASRCLGCHKPVADRIAAKKGVHREVTGDCEACHAEHKGAADLRPLDPQAFDHKAETGFSLEGRHGSAPAGEGSVCAKCHTTRSYMALGPACDTCHRDPHQGAMDAPCASCHDPKSGFKNASRDFHKKTVFPLEGRHLTVPCASCHVDGAVKGTPTRCYDCHWIRRQDDPNRTRLGRDCENCHRPVAWTAVAWDHGARTGLALNVPHRTVACEKCHVGRQYQSFNPDCVGCHRGDYQRTQNPNHAAAGFPTDCILCHKPSDTSFDQAFYVHSGLFPLVGAHALQACVACHANGVYKGTSTLCYSCHQTQYAKAANPNHAAAGFPTTCEICHKASDASFSQGVFNHGGFYALLGVHATQPCAACHANNVYKGTSTLCYSCHQTQYAKAANPNHIGAGFPTTCEICHKASDASFAQGVFNHTYFPITTARHNASCSTCHVDPTNYAVFSCFACHTKSATDAKHAGRTGYRYDSAACYACHPNGNG